MITDDEFRMLFRLRAIPQRNAHFMCVHGDDIAVCRELVKRGMVVEGELAFGSVTFRLNKKGRDVLVGEWLRRGQPKLNDIDPIEWPARTKPTNP